MGKKYVKKASRSSLKVNPEFNKTCGNTELQFKWQDPSRLAQIFVNQRSVIPTGHWLLQDVAVTQPITSEILIAPPLKFNLLKDYIDFCWDSSF